jgi:hypothetical protein
MARIIDILRRVLANPNAKAKDLLDDEDRECIRRTVGGPPAPVKKASKK